MLGTSCRISSTGAQHPRGRTPLTLLNSRFQIPGTDIGFMKYDQASDPELVPRALAAGSAPTSVLRSLISNADTCSAATRHWRLPQLAGARLYVPYNFGLVAPIGLARLMCLRGQGDWGLTSRVAPGESTASANRFRMGGRRAQTGGRCLQRFAQSSSWSGALLPLAPGHTTLARLVLTRDVGP